MDTEKHQKAVAEALATARAALRREMEAKGVKTKPLATNSGNGETFLRDFLKGLKGDVQVGKLAKVAAELEIPLWRLFASDLTAAPSVEAMSSLLEDALRTPPPGGWSASDASSLAQVLEYGLAAGRTGPTTRTIDLRKKGGDRGAMPQARDSEPES